VKKAGLVAIALAVAGALGAVDLDTITVTGTGSPQRLAETPVVTEVLSEQEIQASGAANLTEVLTAYGILVDASDSHGDQVTLQGLGGARVLFLIDGRRIVGRVAQNLEGTSVPLANVERIEIVRGPQSALYGSDAMGGVINIITKKPTGKVSGSLQVENTSLPAYNDPDTARSAQMGAAPFQSQTAAGVLNVPFGDLWTTWTASGSRSGFYYDELGEVSLLPRSWSGKLGVEAQTVTGVTTLWTLGTSASAVQEDDQTDFTGSLSRREMVRGEGHGTWKTTLGDGASLEVKASDQWYARRTGTTQGSATDWTLASPDVDGLGTLEAWYSRDIGDEHTLTVGAEAAWELVHSPDLAVDGYFASVDRQALVAQDTWISAPGSLVSGLRLERDSRFGLVAAPKVSAMVTPWDGLRLLAGAGLGYRAPSTEDLYYDIDWSWHPIVHGNTSLRPEYSLAANLGAEQTWDNRASARINGYHQELFDEIVYVEVGTAADGRVIYQNQNRDRTTRTGADLELSLTPWAWLKVDGAWGYLFAWDRTSNAVLEDQPAHRLKVGSTVTVPGWGTSVRGAGRWDSLGGLWVWDAGVTQPWGPGFEVFLRGENLTSALNSARGPSTPVSLTVGGRIHG